MRTRPDKARDIWRDVARYALAALVGWPLAALVGVWLTDEPFDESLASTFPMVVITVLFLVAAERATRRFLPRRGRDDD
ncbi:hypothetical protein Ais01nite_81900 [Asanoa ishikariensis]|uniref:Uncharacterized protein n=1 Tax=Asanoa ishikariensis TaxID=137265 RepID=A0A1H3SE61_9ACTN|nr:hypothetical protein [Asanoa ishikariensis]GIF70155.1 hypothetical protein Ais01nite_81900 [Asanoa ishikariensis]SDZ35885.1 hypothetical protein SAMN05421684_4847 [Asanoa ishikariensis]